MKTTWIAVALIALTLAWPLAIPTPGHAEEARISMDLHDALLKDTLESLKRDGGIGGYTLAPGLEDRRVTVTLTDVTATDAVKGVLDQAGAEAVDDGTTLLIRAKAVAPPPAPAIVEPVSAPTQPSVTPAWATSTSGQAAATSAATTGKQSRAGATGASNGTGNSAQGGNRSRSRGGFNGSGSGTIGHGARGHSRGGFRR